MVDTTIEVQLQQVLSASTALQRAALKQVLPVAGDASNREYFRAHFTGAPHSAIVLRYGDAKGPQLAGEKILQSEAMRVLGPYLADRGIPVPKLLTYHDQDRIFLFEDLGDIALAALARGQEQAAAERIEQACGSEWLVNLFRKAIDICHGYQQIPHDPQALLFKRGLAFENYRKEASEFAEFYAPTQGVTPAEVARLEQLFDAVCESLLAVPKLPAHFDFHGYNLLVDRELQLRVIDFQDGCMVSCARDLFSLLNDRDMDSILGRERQAALLRYFLETVRPPPQFEQYYNLTALHWDLRVSGRFVKLCQMKNTDRFYQWLPGTLRRLGRTLQRMHRTIHGLEDMLEIVSRLSGEAREGIADPWDFPAISSK